MEIMPIVGITATSLVFLLLIILMVQLRKIWSAVTEMANADERRRPPSTEPNKQIVQIGTDARAAVAQLELVGSRLSAIERQLNTISVPTLAQPAPSWPTAVASSPVPTSAEPVERTIPQQDEADLPPVKTDKLILDSASSATEGTPPWVDSRAKDILEKYRKLIAQPRKAEINRWADELGGQSCEVTEDDGFQLLDRDSGALLVLLELDEQTAIVVPGGRLVVDFATNFSNAISMRSVTRQTFELVNDGSGILRVLEPAFVKRKNDAWVLLREGRISGLNAD